jgi:uncharacterized protein involved in outer membrane biogenesis
MAEELAKPRRRVWRWVAIIVALVVLLPAVGLAIFLATLDLDSYKPRITAAAEQATGRKLELNGPIGLGVSLVPTLQLRDVAFANMAGGSRPQMVTVREVDIELALLPLLSKRVELRRLVLVAPDILLETDAQGRPNWQFQPAAAPPAQPAQPAQPAVGGAGLSFGIGRISITDDFGQTAVFDADNITGRMLENMDASKQAHIGRHLHQQRMQAEANKACESDPVIRQMMRGPAVLSPVPGFNGARN